MNVQVILADISRRLGEEGTGMSIYIYIYIYIYIALIPALPN